MEIRLSAAAGERCKRTSAGAAGSLTAPKLARRCDGGIFALACRRRMMGTLEHDP
jgi:hypothetical protein